MSFSIKQLLLLVLYVAVGLVALMSVYRPWEIYLQVILRGLVIDTLVVAAYSVWSYAGESRAFYAGLVLWGMCYLIIHVMFPSERFNFGTTALIERLGIALHPELHLHPDPRAKFVVTGQWWLTLFFALIGGWVTVYFYRERQRTLGHKDEQSRQ